MERPHLGAEAANDPGQLHVVRLFHRDRVARVQQRQRQQVIRFGGAVGHFDVVHRGAGIQRRDALAQFEGAVGLAVPERLIEESVEVEAHADELAQRQRPDAALAHVVVDEVLPRRLHPFHGKDFNRQSLIPEPESESLSRIPISNL